MADIIYVEANGTEHRIEAEPGTSVMQAAINNLIPGIEGDCGGLCACGTCHVYVPEDWRGQCGDRGELEDAILAFAFDVRDESRLACQIEFRDELDGLIVHLPERQY